MKPHCLLALLLLPAFAAQSQENLRLTGCTRFWKNNGPVSEVRLKAEGLPYPGIPLPGTTWGFAFDPGQSCHEGIFPKAWVMPDAQVYIYPDKADDARNGLSVLDLVVITRHLHGKEPLLPPFAFFAADANMSGSVTSFDVMELRKLLMGTYTELPNSPEWAFFPEYVQFTDPDKPFQIDPASYSLSAAQFLAYDKDTLHIVALKKGDLDGDANLSGGAYQAPVGEDSLSVILPDMVLESGQEVSIPVGLEVPAQAINGVQLRLNFNMADLQVTSILEGDGTSPDNFGIHSDGLAAVIEQADSIAVVGDAPLFTFKARWNAPTAANLKDVMTLAQTGLPPLAVRYASGTRRIYRLYPQFRPTVAVYSPSANTLKATLATPNPFTDKALVKIELDAAALVLLEVFDLDGRQRWRSEQMLGAGTQHLEIPAEAVAPGGVGLYRVQTGRGVATGRVCRGK
jgi:hypothetical protein